MKYEKSCFTISYNTIYRAIYNGLFDEPNLNPDKRGAIRKLRHRGKTRHTREYEERRGNIKISHTIHERPLAANERLELGHWEADTVAGKTGKACLVTLTDRRSRFLLLGKVEKKVSEKVINHMITMFLHLPTSKCRTVPPIEEKNLVNINV